VNILLIQDSFYWQYCQLTHSNTCYFHVETV